MESRQKRVINPSVIHGEPFSCAVLLVLRSGCGVFIMIKLIGVLSEGGVSVQVKSSVATKSDILLGALIEAARTLSSAVGSGEVLKLDFRDQKLIVTESEKGYTIVALVDRAEDYMDTLIRIIAEEIDESVVPRADGCVTDLHLSIVEAILEAYIKHEIDVTLTDTLRDVWSPIQEALVDDSTYAEMVGEIERQLRIEYTDDEWMKFKKDIKSSLTDALWYARGGEFDKACAASIDVESTAARAFALRTGLISLSMTKTCPPPVSTLMEIAETLPDEVPIAHLAKSALGRFTREVTSIDYSHDYSHAANSFEFVDDEEHLLQAFVFVDIQVAEHPEFATQLSEYFRKNELEVLSSYIATVVERASVFNKIYSMTSYDDFKEDLGLWKMRIASTLELIERVLSPDRMRSLLSHQAVNQLGQQGALQLQNYLTLLTAIAESPVLSVGERRGILREVLSVYQSYFKKLLETNIPLFIYTVDSAFQSLSVAYAEYYHLTSGPAQERTLVEVADYLRTVSQVVQDEWMKIRGRIALDVITNALSPILTMAGELHQEEIRLILAAVKTLELRDIDAQLVLDPMTFATNLGNVMCALASLSGRVLNDDKKRKVSTRALSNILLAHQLFLTNGVVCRDDIIAATYHAAQSVEILEEDFLRRVVKTLIVLNRVSVQDPVKHDYEVAMMGFPLIQLLMKSWRRIGDDSLYERAKMTFDTAVNAWRKYGFHDKAKEFEESFPELL
jgi:hypothetical protein